MGSRYSSSAFRRQAQQKAAVPTVCRVHCDGGKPDVMVSAFAAACPVCGTVAAVRNGVVPGHMRKADK